MAYRITEKYYENGKTECIACEVKNHAKEKPFSEIRERYDIYIYYVDTYEEVEEAIERCENA